MFSYISKRKISIVLIICLLFLLSYINTIWEKDNDIKTITVSAVGDCTLGKNYKIPYENSWEDVYALGQ